MPRHFLTGGELSATELEALIDRALELKRAPLSSQALSGRCVGLVFEKPSTRTRVSFEVGVRELGGHAVVLRADELQISRGEALHDTALVLSRHLVALGVRSGDDATVQQLAEHSAVPVINMLTPQHHPCQALADLMTLREAYGSLRGPRRLCHARPARPRRGGDLGGCALREPPAHLGPGREPPPRAEGAARAARGALVIVP